MPALPSDDSSQPQNEGEIEQAWVAQKQNEFRVELPVPNAQIRSSYKQLSFSADDFFFQAPSIIDPYAPPEHLMSNDPFASGMLGNGVMPVNNALMLPMLTNPVSSLASDATDYGRPTSSDHDFTTSRQLQLGGDNATVGAIAYPYAIEHAQSVTFPGPSLALTDKPVSDSLQLPVDTPFFGDLLAPWDDAATFIPDTLNITGAEWLCFGQEGWYRDEIQRPVAIAPKPTVIYQSTTNPFMPQSASLGNCEEPVTKKRKKFDEKDREKVSKVRKLGACFRCKIYKLTCDEELPCKNCLKVRESRKVYRGPCIRLNMDEVHTFRASDADNGTLRPTLPTYRWVSGGEKKTVNLQWPFRDGTKNLPILTIDLEKFHPKKENVAEEFFANGVVRVVKLPPWACRNTGTAQRDIEKFMTACHSLLEEEIRVILLDPILLLTWEEARRYRAKYGSPIITNALKIFAFAMMNSKYPRAIEPTHFGVEDEAFTPYFFEKQPLPAQLTFQIQTMVAAAMIKIQTEVLKDLKRRIFSKDRLLNWYEVFLATFVLLATLEWVYQCQIRFVTAKEGVSARNLANISYVTQYVLDEWEASAFNLVGHFRCVMNGEVPFGQSWEDEAENPRRTGLDEEALTYIRNIKRETEARNGELRALRALQGKERFERPLAVICELFLPTDESN